MTGNQDKPKSKDFLRNIVESDLKNHRYNKIITRFPPEPNGFPHIGHAKSICINFGIAKDYNGVCHLRMDDTNPSTEDEQYVEALKDSVKWLGFDWGDNLFFASSYFEKLYEYAKKLVKLKKAYVCSLSEEQIREYRGTVKQPGKESPYRNRSVEENLELLEKMKNGEFLDGEHVLRAKIDMTSSNMKMRDPLLYRIRHSHHYRTADKWNIYPMYDFAHCLSDYIEGISHSICTLEFENNREIYDWILDNLELPNPRPYQYEFARLNINYTVMSKRRLLELVQNKHVSGWDDPRMPTIAGLRRRGYTPESIKKFCESVGIAKSNSVVDFSQLEFHIRDDLNKKVPRVMCVMNPLKIVIENYDNEFESIKSSYYPQDVPKEGFRDLPFSREIYIEKDDFSENPPKGYFRLTPTQPVRLKHAYIISCNEVIKDNDGNILEVRANYYPDSKSGEDLSGIAVKSAIHWVSVPYSKKVEVRKYDRLYNVEDPDGPEDLNPDSLKVIDAYIEPCVINEPKEERFQFERQGYFYLDPVDSTQSKLVFNRIVALKDSWGKNKKSEIKSREKKEPAISRQKQRTEYSFSDEQEKKFNVCKNDFNINPEVASILVKDDCLYNYFEAALKLYNNPVSVANWVSNELSKELKSNSCEKLNFSMESFISLIKLNDDEIISTKTAKDVFKIMLKEDIDPVEYIERMNLKQINDLNKLESIANEVITAQKESVQQYKSGKTNILGFLQGQAMKLSGGKANPVKLKQVLIEKLT